ncbi:MAG: Na+/H+ antiporter subunit E [Haloferacaceae archaeon]
MMRRWPFTGVVLAVLWLFVRGVALTPARLAQEFVIGLLVGLPLAYGLRRFYGPSAPLSAWSQAVPYGGVYLLVFFKELLTANWDVARRVLSPSLPIEPAVVEVPLRVRTDAAITTIANSITLTPGTLTMDYDAERNALYVHSIDGSDRDAILAPIRKWEDLALRIFEEDLNPEDPVPASGSTDDPANRAGDADATAESGGERE